MLCKFAANNALLRDVQIECTTAPKAIGMAETLCDFPFSLEHFLEMANFFFFQLRVQ